MSMQKTFDFQTCERAIDDRWERAKAFRAGANAREGADSYCIMIPPPNVTGNLHMGHAFNNTLQDILVRWHRMRGFDTLWQPGQDHAGIATQMVVERQLADSGLPGRRDMGRAAFLDKIWEWKEASGGTIVNQLKRLGASCDWDRNRFTMDTSFHDAVLRVFVALYKKGLIYRGKRLVNWDPHFETAISDLEVVPVEQTGKLWRFRYALADGVTYRHPVVFDADGSPAGFETRDYVVVATTRPETMLGDTGVAVHPEDGRYRELVGRMVVLPLTGRRVPIVADSYADPTKGTGAVKMTPAHDFNDFEVAKRTGLRSVNVMDTKAAMALVGNADFLEGCAPPAETMRLHGLDRMDARKRVVDLAGDQGWLDGVDDDVHVVPHGDRSGVPVEPYLTDQWFVDAAKLAGPAMDVVHSGRTRILPEQHEKAYFRWLEDIEPWCISRQLWWGHQIPVWYDEDGNAYCENTEAEALVAAGGRPLIRDEDVLDTWFSSALWPFGTLGWPEETSELARYYPTDVLVTGFDIIFFWVARMMMMGLNQMDEAPFHTVYVHALVRDEKGKKMSKSLGNVIDPIELIDAYGADAVRFTLTSMAAMGRDLKLSRGRVQGYRNFGTKLWNAARFAGLNGCQPRPDLNTAAPQRPVNRWILGETARVRASVDAAHSEYRFNDAANALYAHVWGRVCDWYVEFSKPLFQGEDKESAEETRATMGWVIDQCLILLHPFMPFITEQLWGDVAERSTMLVHTDWPEYDVCDLAVDVADREMNWVIRLIEQIRSVRVQLRVPAGATVPLSCLQLSAHARTALESNSAIVRRLARTSEVSRRESAPAGAVTIPVDGGVFLLELDGIVDTVAERERLLKACSGIDGEIGKIRSRLANDRFIANAPDHVVDEQHARLETLAEELSKLKSAIDQIPAA
ncbi:MAG: valine--tRNA ligase [Paracoccaceae bacterium]|nr:valine--tRNA ligase [Paracoccaceae bacterium]